MAIKEGVKLVKFENKFYELIQNSYEGFQLKQVSDDDIADAVVLNVDLDSLRNYDMEGVLEETKSQCLKEAKEKLKSVVWAAMGFDTKWSEWEIKQNSLAANLITTNIKDFILNQQLEADKFLLKPEESVKLKVAIEKSIRDAVKRNLESYRIDRIVEDLVRNEAVAILKQHVRENIGDLLVRQTKGTEIKKDEIVDVVKGEDGTIKLVTKACTVNNEYVVNREEDEED